jgi:hypothetical protein
MELFTKEKTNWKYILIILILAVIIGGGILWWSKSQKIFFTEFPKIERPRFKTIQIKGVIEFLPSSWSPSFDKECISPSPVIRYQDKIYYLDGICSFQALFGYLIGKEVVIEGVVEERELDVPLVKTANPPTRKETFQVINIRDLKLVED